MGDVALGAGEEIVDADEVGASLQQALAQMRTEKSGSAGHENAFFEMHGLCRSGRTSAVLGPMMGTARFFPARGPSSSMNSMPSPGGDEKPVRVDSGQSVPGRQRDDIGVCEFATFGLDCAFPCL
jgi:hypothetical protein